MGQVTEHNSFGAHEEGTDHVAELVQSTHKPTEAVEWHLHLTADAEGPGGYGTQAKPGPEHHRV